MDILNMIIQKSKECIDETDRIQNDIIEDKNYEQLKIELVEIIDCLIILKQALLYDDDSLSLSEIDSLLNILIKKSYKAVKYAKKLKLEQVSEDFYKNLNNIKN